jgi:hypothetical protein
MRPALGTLAVIFLAIFLIAYGLAGFGVPLGVVVPILAFVTGILILVAK